MTATPANDRPTSVSGVRSPLALEVSDAIRRHLAGDSSAMAEMARLIRPWLYHVVRSQRLPAHLVEDVVQSTMLAVLRHVHGLRDPDAGLAWISVVARREALRELRAQQRYVLVDEPDVVAAPAPDPAEIVLDRLSHVVVRRTFRVLPAQNRRLLEGIVADDRPSYASLSRALKMPIGQHRTHAETEPGAAAPAAGRRCGVGVGRAGVIDGSADRGQVRSNA
jgi:DNA-directed RNA polymerase specialized sigma24 family protein